MDNIKNEILRLKKEKNALILAHYYQSLDIQEAADYVCDSFEMAKRARDAQNNLIIICGVEFMAESAKILSPDKKVLIPRRDAGCQMADMITADDVLKLKASYPEAAVVCYVNSSAAVKALSDICCTSASALNNVKSLKEKQIIFIPDRNLGAYIAKSLPEKEIILYNGCCPPHDSVIARDVFDVKDMHPDALFLAHPECRDEVLELADFIGSTAAIIAFAQKSGAKEFIIGTELEITLRLRKLLPDKRFYPVKENFICRNMKKTTLEDLLYTLKNEVYETELSEEEIKNARASLDRMVR